jgi:hypothetical protein
LLSRPTKLPGPSWSLPAGPACPFRRNGPNTICASCYADDIGRYSQDHIKRAQWTRFAWTRECLRTPEGIATFVQTMVEAIDATGYTYMRVHDSGDLFFTRVHPSVGPHLHGLVVGTFLVSDA